MQTGKLVAGRQQWEGQSQQSVSRLKSFYRIMAFEIEILEMHKINLKLNVFVCFLSFFFLLIFFQFSLVLVFLFFTSFKNDLFFLF